MARTLAYQVRDSRLHRLNPLTPLTYAIAVTVIGLTVGSPWILFAVFFLTLALIVYGKVFGSFIRMFLAISVPIAVPMLLIHGFLYSGESAILWRLGPLSVKEAGVRFAVSVISRLFSMISAYFLLVMVSHPRDLVVALESRNVSHKVGYLVLSTLQLIPYIQRTAETILDAQRSRGLRLKGSLVQRFKSYIPLIAPVVMGSIQALEIRAMALEVRGFNLPTKRTYLHQVPDSALDRALRRLIMVATALLIVGYYALRFVR